ncbi:Sporulation protein [Petrocella atlantisensis]|uniref:Sporulation protein n=1 Tax=Petrocella atlantisensis TaxID=2173034 RepID=A0A3P7RU09_9FIRM|nr:GerW family sporulation protein [Petrocella atlantisensis]MCF8018439.1 GerW family sporulation protein [Vallitaleaceae bacterium]VDN46352.1 Sporulation protein [Petrocella atlantisensis]
MESNFRNTVESLFSGMENFISSKTVVGEPISIGDTIILPLVDVSFGVGAGASEAKKADGPQGGGGGGLGAKISPSAVLVIQGGHTKLVNVKNQDSLTKIIDMVPDIMDKFAAKDRKKEDKVKDIL